MSDRRDPQRIRVTDKRVGSDDAPEAAPEKPQFDDVAVEANKLADERLDQLKRLKADFENYRTRVIREQTDLVERASLRVIERLLPVLDDLERALHAAREHEPQDRPSGRPSDDAIVRGIELVYKHLHEVLVDEGLERVAAEGAFDPQEHEAVSSVPGDVPEPTVLEVVRAGYKLKGRTIRPALVHVSVPDSPPDSPKEGSE